MMKFSGWWLTNPSEKYEFVSWDGDIPNIWKNKIHLPNNQPDWESIQHDLTNHQNSKFLGLNQKLGDFTGKF